VSLVETVIALTLVGVVVASLLGSMITAVSSTGRQRVQASAESVLRSSAEAIKDPSVVYAACATPATYRPYLAPDPQGRVSARIATVEFWDGNPSAWFTGTCVTDRGAQLIRVEVVDEQGAVVADGSFVKRRLNP
jgi:Tfp pilus assembly protein PilV